MLETIGLNHKSKHLIDNILLLILYYIKIKLCSIFVYNKINKLCLIELLIYKK